MTDLTDDQVRALAHRYRFAKDDHERTIAQTALALLTARAEKAEAESRVWDHAAGMTTIEKRLADAGMEVKPLEWVWNGASFFASSIVGEYRIAKTANKTNDRYMVTYLAPFRKSHTIGWIDGEGTAKSVAQANYTARILSALQVKP